MYQPQTSELTFTNLFIWRDYYGAKWSIYQDWLLIMFRKPDHRLYALPPIGPPSRLEVTRRFLEWMREQGEKEPRIERADRRLVEELAGASDLEIEPTREHFDYVYRCQDLTLLEGRRFHAKRNYINSFRKMYRFTYEEMTTAHVPACLELADRWCQLRRCDEDMSLAGEWEAVKEALGNFEALKMRGGIITLDRNVEAFTLGELLNSSTAVVHIEKADPDIRGAYAIINQQFCEHAWPDVEFINREQDLGEPTLRETKLSYQPDHLVEKFRIRLKHNG